MLKECVRAEPSVKKIILFSYLYILVHPHFEFRKFLCYENFVSPGIPFSVVIYILFSVHIWLPVFCRGLPSHFLSWQGVPFSIVVCHPVFCCEFASRFLLCFGISFSVVVQQTFSVMVWYPVFGFCLVSCFPLCFNIPFCVVIWHPIFCCDMASRFLFFGIPLSVVT